jgi:hypothetical protein
MHHASSCFISTIQTIVYIISYITNHKTLLVRRETLFCAILVLFPLLLSRSKFQLEKKNSFLVMVLKPFFLQSYLETRRPTLPGALGSDSDIRL